MRRWTHVLIVAGFLPLCLLVSPGLSKNDKRAIAVDKKDDFPTLFYPGADHKFVTLAPHEIPISSIGVARELKPQRGRSNDDDSQFIIPVTQPTQPRHPNNLRDDDFRIKEQPHVKTNLADNQVGHPLQAIDFRPAQDPPRPASPPRVQVHSAGVRNRFAKPFSPAPKAAAHRIPHASPLPRPSSVGPKALRPYPIGRLPLRALVRPPVLDDDPAFAPQLVPSTERQPHSLRPFPGADEPPFSEFREPFEDLSRLQPRTRPVSSTVPPVFQESDDSGNNFLDEDELFTPTPVRRPSQPSPPPQPQPPPPPVVRRPVFLPEFQPHLPSPPLPPPSPPPLPVKERPGSTPNFGHPFLAFPPVSDNHAFRPQQHDNNDLRSHVLPPSNQPVSEPPPPPNFIVRKPIFRINHNDINNSPPQQQGRHLGHSENHLDVPPFRPSHQDFFRPGGQTVIHQNQQQQQQNQQQQHQNQQQQHQNQQQQHQNQQQQHQNQQQQHQNQQQPHQNQQQQHQNQQQHQHQQQQHQHQQFQQQPQQFQQQPQPQQLQQPHREPHLTQGIETTHSLPTAPPLPRTSFTCRDWPMPGYYADVEAGCKTFHVCYEKRQFTFMCPSGTLFDQRYLVCAWWYGVDCARSQSFYTLNSIFLPDADPTTHNRLKRDS